MDAAALWERYRRSAERYLADPGPFTTFAMASSYADFVRVYDPPNAEALIRAQWRDMLQANVAPTIAGGA